MKLRGRLDYLERNRLPAKQPYTGARELLQDRFERANPETQAQLLAAISERKERAAKK